MSKLERRKEEELGSIYTSDVEVEAESGKRERKAGSRTAGSSFIKVEVVKVK